MFFQLLKCFQKVTAGFERHETKLCIITLMYPELQRQGLRWSRLWCLSLFHARNSTENGYGSLKMPTVWSILGSKIRAMLRDPFISGRESLQDLPWLPVDVLQNQRAEFKKSWAIPIAFLHLKPIFCEFMVRTWLQMSKSRWPPYIVPRAFRGGESRSMASNKTQQIVAPKFSTWDGQNQIKWISKTRRI